jgi:hypothetical protein
VSQPRSALLRLESFAGGLNDTDPAHRIGDDQLAAATDVELTTSGGIIRRNGASRVMLPPSTTALISLLHRHTPSQSLAAAEIWAIPTSASVFYRSVPADGYTWSASVSVTDTGSSVPPTDIVSFNGKLYVAYEKNAGTDRLNVWDGTSVRRAGISTPAAPTVANTGAGAYAATIRYYKVQFQYAAGGKYTFSDLSTAQSFTPSGAGTHARVTKPATVDSATNWRVWASADNISYYLVATNAVATTTYDDNTAPASYATSNLGANFIPPDAGTYTPAWSAKYLLVDENRLLIAGAFETAQYASRIGWSAILGTAMVAYGEGVVVSDDERFPPTNYLDLDSDEGGEITGMESLNGAVYVFKRGAIYKLVRTGNADAAYRPITISKAVGAISRKSIVVGEDESGAPCLYFLSERGPYRLGVSGVQFLGGDIKTTWALVNTDFSTWKTQPHGLYDASNDRVHFWVGLSDLDVYGNMVRLTFHVRHGRVDNGRVRGGWTKTASTSKPMHAAASALLPTDFTVRESQLVPYGIHTYNGLYSSYPPVVWKYSTGISGVDTTVDAAGAITGDEYFPQTFTTKTFSLGMGDKNGVTDVYVTSSPYSSAGPTLTVTLTRDFGMEARTASHAFVADYTASGGGVFRLPQQIPDLTMAQAQYVSVTVAAQTTANGTRHTVDEIALRVRREEPV